VLRVRTAFAQPVAVMRVATLLPLISVLGACAPSPYAAGTIVRDNDVAAASLRSAGCLDLAVGLRPASDPDDNALLVTRFGNKCLRPAPFDLGSIILTGRDEEGATVSLQLVDPRSEIALLHVDAGMQGVEKIRVAGSDRPLSAICIDVTRVLRSSPLPPVCFGRKGAAAWEVLP
jgi:hypothetical protein